MWGDIDHFYWVEPHPKKKIICVQVTCEARDDDTVIYMAPKEWHGLKILNNFHARRCWRKQKKQKWNFGDLRDFKEPSINTYSRHCFELIYGDPRDTGYCFTLKYDHRDKPAAGGAMHFAGEMKSAIFKLEGLELVLKKPIKLMAR